jgi:hypothetical protein
MQSTAVSCRRACVLLGISRRWAGYTSRARDDGRAERLRDLAIAIQGMATGVCGRCLVVPESG